MHEVVVRLAGAWTLATVGSKLSFRAACGVQSRRTDLITLWSLLMGRLIIPAAACAYSALALWRSWSRQRTFAAGR
jgi:hypothetical protein